MIYFLQEFMASSCARTCGFCDDSTVTTRYCMQKDKKLKDCIESYYLVILTGRRTEATEFLRKTRHWHF